MELPNLFNYLFSNGQNNNKGFTEEEILQAEDRLGTRLPEGFRNFYLHQVRNILINSCHFFEHPKRFELYEDQWFGFYGENQGICFWCFNINEFQNDHQKVYVNYEQQGFEVEANSFKDFIIIRAASDYQRNIYPYKMVLENVSNEDIDKLIEKFGAPKSEIYPKNYPSRKMFWNDEKEVAGIVEWEHFKFPEKRKLIISSMDEQAISNYKKLFPDRKWFIDEKIHGYFTESYLERQISDPKEPETPSIKITFNEDEDYDLPF